MGFKTIRKIRFENLQLNISITETKPTTTSLETQLDDCMCLYFDYEKPRSDHAHTHSQFLLYYIIKYRKQNQSF